MYRQNTKAVLVLRARSESFVFKKIFVKYTSKSPSTSLSCLPLTDLMKEFQALLFTTIMFVI